MSVVGMIHNSHRQRMSATATDCKFRLHPVHGVAAMIVVNVDRTERGDSDSAGTETGNY